jgi:hypothetical protein
MLRKSHRELRFRLIDRFIREKDGTLKDMLSFVNDRLALKGYQSIKERMLQYDLDSMRKGEFEAADDTIRPNKKGQIYTIEYNRESGSYEYIGTPPSFNDLNEEERMTVPFLMGILKKYDRIPAVKRIIHGMSDFFDLEEHEIHSTEAVVVKEPSMMDIKEEKKVIQLAVNILGHISRNEMIEFRYHNVDKLGNKGETAVAHTVYPLVIRMHNQLYYLTAFEETPKFKSLVNFRLDLFYHYRVEAALDENEEPVVFNKKKIRQLADLDNNMKESIGVWIHDETYHLHIVRFRFTHWAATYIRKVKLHDTQRIVVNEEEAYVDVEFSVFLKPEYEKKSGRKLDIYERNPELGFLLGRFRNDCQLITIK